MASVDDQAAQPAQIPPTETEGNGWFGGGDRDGAAWGFAGWAKDDKVPNCPRCDAEFTMLFRRHHCKECGILTCDNCSKGRMRLPKFPNGRKVRVCNLCVQVLSETQANDVEEDLAENAEIIKHIRQALKSMHSENDKNKQVFLELEAEVLGDRSGIDAYLADPQADKYSFARLGKKLESKWSELIESVESNAEHRDALVDLRRQAKVQLDAVSAEVQNELRRKSELDAKILQLEKDLEEAEEIKRRVSELQKSVEDARKQVQDLEAECAERQDRRAQRSFRFLPAQSTASREAERPSPQIGPAAIAVSTGRRDPLISQEAETPNRGCQLM